MIGNISNHLLIEVYLKAITFRLDQEFLYLIINEMERRGIDIEDIDED